MTVVANEANSDSATWRLHCHQCANLADDGSYRCPSCGGALQVRYNTEIPPTPTDEVGIWRFADRLPIGASTPHITLGEGNVPHVILARLSKEMDLRISAKVEAQNPTGTFKDRSMAVGISKALEFGAETVAIASAGNAGAACAAYAARAELDCIVLVPEITPRERLIQIQVAGARVICIKGSTREAVALLEMARERFDWHLLTTSAAVNPYQAEGTRSVGYELAEQWAETPDWLVVPVGGGGLLTGIMNAFADLQGFGRIASIPRVLAVQAAGCAPLVRAFDRGASLTAIEPWGEPETIVASLADPVPFDGFTALGAIRRSGGTAIAVDDEAILDAQQHLAKMEGLFVEPAAAATLAGLIRAKENAQIKPGSHVTLVLSGSGFKDLSSAGRRHAPPVTIRPTMEDFLKTFE